MGIKRKSSSASESVSEQQPPPILAKTPEEHLNAATRHSFQQSEHQEASLDHKALAEAYKTEGLRKLCKRHKALAKYYEVLAKAHQKTAIAHEKLVTPLIVAK
jgi:hypothetical protein